MWQVCRFYFSWDRHMAGKPILVLYDLLAARKLRSSLMALVEKEGMEVRCCKGRRYRKFVTMEPSRRCRKFVTRGKNPKGY